MSDVSEELGFFEWKSADRQGEWAASRAEEEGSSEGEGMNNGLTIEMDVQAVLRVYLESNHLRWMK